MGGSDVVLRLWLVNELVWWLLLLDVQGPGCRTLGMRVPGQEQWWYIARWLSTTRRWWRLLMVVCVEMLLMLLMLKVCAGRNSHGGPCGGVI